ncbi:MAG: CvpA family protein [Chitinophagaceae bacterium]
MLIDILFVLVVVYAIFRGFSRGAIIGIFSLAAFVLGLAAALKLTVAGTRLVEHILKFEASWLPIVIFLILFLGVAMLVNLLARVLEKFVQLALLGWLNRLAGILFYILLYAIFFSVLLWFANQLYLITPSMKESSRTYSYLIRLGPNLIRWIANFLPIFKDVFHDLEAFFVHAAGVLHG